MPINPRNPFHRTTSQEAPASGHQEAESAATAHASLPWRSIMSDRYVVGPNGYFVASVVQGRDGFRTAEAEANAALIVKAVNNHDALMKALENVAAATMPGEARRIAHDALSRVNAVR